MTVGTTALGARPRRTLGVDALRRRLAPRHAALAGVLALAAVLDVYRLSQNGWANGYYSAAVKSMLGSLHNFLYVSFDPGGLVSVDKPPVALWVQTLSAKVFGFSPLSLLLPQAIAGVLAVAVLYRIVARRFGAPAGLIAALALAAFPSLVAVARDNNPDAILVLLMLLACGAALRAIETGRLRTLIGCAVLVGLAFNTKMLAAYLVVPGIAVGYLVCAPGTLRARLARIAAAGVVLLAVSAVWMAFVDLTPASQRPYVGSSQNNSEFGLALNYNGVGRVAGQTGGPGGIRGPGGTRRLGAAPRLAQPGTAPGFGGPPGGGAPPSLFGSGPSRGFAPGAGGPFGRPPGGRGGGPGGNVFGGATGPMRLFEAGLGDQGAWLLPFALFGAVGIALTLRRRRTSPRLAVLLVLGGWFLTEVLVLSFAQGIVHPYYVSALGPGLAALVGAGAVSIGRLVRRRHVALVLAAAAIVTTIAAQIVLLDRASYMQWFVPVLLVGAIAALSVLVLRRRWALPATAAAAGLLAVAPAAYAATAWNSPVSGTFPAAGQQQAGPRPGLPPGSSGLVAFLRAHPSGTRWQILTQSAQESEQLIIDGIRAGSVGGFNGDDPALSATQLATLVARGEVRYVESGGAFPGRGANGATGAARKACRAVPSSEWQGSGGGTDGFGPGAFGPGAPGAFGPGGAPGAIGSGGAPGAVGPGGAPGAVGPGGARGATGSGAGPGAFGPAGGFGPGAFGRSGRSAAGGRGLTLYDCAGRSAQIRAAAS